jgi:hypothetical protein
MKFWEATFETTVNGAAPREEKVRIGAPKVYKKAKVVEIITEIHPEWKNITIKRCKKPKKWLLFK